MPADRLPAYVDELGEHHEIPRIQVHLAGVGRTDRPGVPVVCRFRAGHTLWTREAWRVLRPARSPWTVERRADGSRAPVRDGAPDDDLAAWGSRCGWVYVDGRGWCLYGPALAARWQTSLHQPRWAARYVDLPIVSVRAERLLQIDDDDAVREGLVSRDVFLRRFLELHTKQAGTYATLAGGELDQVVRALTRDPWVWRIEWAWPEVSHAQP